MGSRVGSDSRPADARHQAPSPGWGRRTSDFVLRRARLIVGSAVVLTFALGWPMVMWTPDETASQSPDTEITRAQELAADRFADDTFRYLFVVEPAGGDVLDQEPMQALLDNANALRRDPAVADYLLTSMGVFHV